MKLNAMMIYEAVREKSDVMLLGTYREERTLRFAGFFDGNMKSMIAGGVYLAKNKNLPRKATDQTDILWVSWSGTPPVAIPKCPVLFFNTEKDPMKILNLIQEVFVKFDIWEEEIHRILNGKNSIPKMIEVSEHLFRHPLCVVDTSLNYLGYSSAFLSKGKEVFFPDRKSLLHKNEEEDSIKSAALFYDKKQDKTLQLKNEEFSLGAVYMIHNDIPFSATEEVVFGLLAEKLSSALRNIVIISGLYKNSFKQQMKSYFNTKHTEEGRLYASLEEWGGKRGDTFICYKVKASDINQEINAEYICSIFENALDSAISFWYDSVLLVIVDVTKSGKKEEKIHEKMRSLLEKLHLKAGVSLPFTHLTLSWYCYRQACCAFEEGYNLGEKDHLYFFHNYVGKYVLHHATGEFPVRYLMDRGLQNISKHDELYSVSYMDTLAEFFRCGMNMSKTADALGIHRTSLNSRMLKIKECLSHEMDQQYMLYLQIMIALMGK